MDSEELEQIKNLLDEFMTKIDDEYDELMDKIEQLVEQKGGD